MIRLAAVFSDHAVLQRDVHIPVWGWTQPNEQVKARLGAVVAETRSGPDGRFLLRLPPLAAGGPYELEVNCGGDMFTARDILIGEVWLASGQSNMQWSLSSCGEQGFEAIRAADQKPIRMLNVPNRAVLGRQRDIEAQWQVAGPDTAGVFSAVGFHFASKLHGALQVPIGILNSSWGGTMIETWMSREALVQNPDTRVWTHRYESTVFNPAFWDGAEPEAAPYPADLDNEGERNGWAGPDFADEMWEPIDLPRTWQAEGHQFSGVFWFRRTVNVSEQWAGRDLSLCLGAVDKHDTTYFNGERVGATGRDYEQQHWNQLRTYTVPGRLVKPGRNVIAVRAYSFIHHGGMIGPSQAMTLGPAGDRPTAIPLAGPWRYRIEQNFGLIQPPTLQMGPGNPNSPYMLFDNMIYPLIPYAIGGAIWYQGESNAGAASQYRELLTSLIRDWRRAWGQDDFPFLFVQLANYTAPSEYQDGSTWAALRDAQFGALSEPNTGMAVAIDIGDAVDIHPQNKRDVGHRLAQWAITRVYDQPGVASGPLYRSMSIEGSSIRLRFDHIGRGLTANGKLDLSHFVIAGSNRRFAPAQARIEGNAVVVHSPDVAEPVAVRYAWADNPQGCNLLNIDGFPASPFRTDRW